VKVPAAEVVAIFGKAERSTHEVGGGQAPCGVQWSST
jgi:hypothetical protein